MRALWLGRFQPPTIAHFAALLKILDVYHEVKIGVVFNGARPSDVNPTWIPILDQEDLISYTQEKNPFSSEEVIAMWDSTISTCRLETRVSCCAIKRPQFFDFNLEFPPEKYVLVSTGGHDRMSMHQEMFRRTVHHFNPTVVLHNSEIKLLVKGGRDWQDFTAPGAWKVFHSLKGESRLA